MTKDATIGKGIRRRALARLVALSSFLLPWALRGVEAADGIVDAVLVGAWELSGINQYGPWKLVWEIRADGSYSIGGSISDHGVISAKSGTWIMTSGVSGMRSVGTYKLHEANALETTGPLGLGRWRRVGEAKAAPPPRSSATPEHRS